MFFVMSDLQTLNTMYHFSTAEFLSLFSKVQPASLRPHPQSCTAAVPLKTLLTVKAALMPSMLAHDKASVQPDANTCHLCLCTWLPAPTPLQMGAPGVITAVWACQLSKPTHHLSTLGQTLLLCKQYACV